MSKTVKKIKAVPQTACPKCGHVLSMSDLGELGVRLQLNLHEFMTRSQELEKARQSLKRAVRKRN